MLKALVLVAFFFITGCVTGVVSIDDVDVTVNDLHRIIVNALPVRLRTELPSGREFYSEYFVPKNGDFEEASGGPHRFYAYAQIIGDTKPYRIEVTVRLERRVREGHYETERTEEGLARVIIRRIQKALHERREDRNVIDDFRVF